MQAVVYIGGRIVKWYNGTRKNCRVYIQGAVEGLEASGARLGCDTVQGELQWVGHNHIGQPIYIFMWEGK